MGLTLLRDVDFTKSPLRWIRRSLGMSLRDLSVLTHLSLTAVSEIERGVRDATEEEAKAITFSVSGRLSWVIQNSKKGGK